MAHNTYTDEQIGILLDNPYVAGCTSKYITFTIDCKREAIRLSMEMGLPSKDIFSILSFPNFITDSELPIISLKRWRRTVQKEGVEGLTEKKKGQRKKERDIENRTPEEDIVYLRAQVAYLKQENDFLRLLRAQRNK